MVISSLLVIGAVTLAPVLESPRPNVGSSCVLCGELGTPDFVLNVLLFLPLGAGLGRLGMRPLHAAGLTLALAGLIEAAQIVIPGRAPTWRDALSNGLGGGLGALLAWRIRGWISPSRTASRGLWAAASLPLCALAFTGPLLVVAPPAGPYFAHWAPQQGHLERWTGTLARARIDSIDLPTGRVGKPEAVREALSVGATIALEGLAGVPTNRLGGIFSLSDEHRREVLLVGPSGTDLVVRLRRRAADLRLDAPDARFAGLLAAVAPGDPLGIVVTERAGVLCAEVNGSRACAAPLAAGSSWTLLRYSGRWPPSLRRTLDAIMLLTLVLPLGLMLGASPRTQAVIAAVVAIIGIPIAAMGAGLAPPSATEWAAVLLGLGGGALLGELIRGSAAHDAASHD